jgi:hypothetical protein
MDFFLFFLLAYYLPLLLVVYLLPFSTFFNLTVSKEPGRGSSWTRHRLDVHACGGPFTIYMNEESHA